MPQLYIVGLGTGLLTVFFDVAYQSYLPHLVGRDNLVEGNSKLEAVRGSPSSVVRPGRVADPAAGRAGRRSWSTR